MSFAADHDLAAFSSRRAFYPGASLALDFTRNRYRVGGGIRSTSVFSALSGVSISRASTGYAETSSGLLVPFSSNVARITDKGLLVEEARTNLFLNSFAPATQNITLSATGNYTITIWGSGSVTVAAGTATITGAGAVAAGSPRTINCTATGTITVTVTGSPTAVNVEAGSFGTSPIPTTGSTATRAADNIVLSGLSGLSSTPLTVAYSFTAVALTSSPTLFLLDDGTANNRVLSYYNTGALGFNVDSGGASQVAVTAAAPIAGATTNRAARIATNDFRVYSDGVAGPSDTTVTLPTALSALRIGRSLAGAVAGSTYHRSLRVYPRAFSDAELQAITA